MKHDLQRHLDSEQIAASVIEQNPELDAHLQACPACREKADALRASLADFGGFVRANAERTNTFWWRQRAASPAPAVPLTRWATAAAALIIAAAASMTFISSHQQPVGPKPVHVDRISDEALLSEVQNDVQREYADAFAPVQTNAESAVAAQPALKIHKKEHKKK